MDIDKNLLRRYFSNRVTLPERQRVREWLQQHADLELYYQVLEEMEQEHLQFEVDTEAAIGRYLYPDHKENSPLAVPPVSVRRFRSPIPAVAFRWLAAAMVVMMSIGGYVWRDALLYKTYATGYGQIRSLVLEDGSRVTLNANSTISIPRWPTEDRQVLLKGEAEFSVVHTRDDRRFLVKTDNQLQVEVLGTEFVVYSRNQSSKVALTKGKVRLSLTKEANAKTLTILPGDVVTVNEKGSLQLKSRQQLLPHTAWKNHLFVFESTALRDIAIQIEDVFGTSVLMSDEALANRKITGTFEAATADELIQALTTVMNLQQVRREPNTIMLLTANTAAPKIIAD